LINSITDELWYDEEKLKNARLSIKEWILDYLNQQEKK
jgi:hypothetical protein